MHVHVHAEHDYPDVGNGESPCCMGSATRGPGGCTCWEREYDQPQQPARSGPMRIRDRMCADCAFRPDSPERRGDERYDNSDEDGLERVVSGAFVCHVGLRRLVRMRHPSGHVVEAMPGAYEPPFPVRKADGSPAELCAGWAAARARLAGEP